MKRKGDQKEGKKRRLDERKGCERRRGDER